MSTTRLTFLLSTPGHECGQYTAPVPALPKPIPDRHFCALQRPKGPQKGKKWIEQMLLSFPPTLKCLAVLPGSHESLCHAPGEDTQEVQP